MFHKRKLVKASLVNTNSLHKQSTRTVNTNSLHSQRQRDRSRAPAHRARGGLAQVLSVTRMAEARWSWKKGPMPAFGSSF